MKKVAFSANWIEEVHKHIEHNLIKKSDTMKKITLEEAAKKFVLSHDFSLIIVNPNYLANFCFQAGAKWQAKRMYSEKDMRKAFIAGGNSRIEEDKLKML